MPKSYFGDRLSAEDAVFLYTETPETPLHIGSVSIFDGPMPFEACRDYVASRLSLIPRYRQRVVTPPFHFGHPTWEPDPTFDIANHVHHVELKRGTDAELRNFAGKLFSRVMDRNRPLWDIVVVNGLTGGRSALICRVHHCLVDGVSGVGLMNILLDPALQSDPKNRKARRVPPLPWPAQSLADAMATSLSEMAARVLAAQSESLDVAQALFTDGTLQALDQLRRLGPEIATPVLPLPFNQPCSAARNVTWTEIPMPEVKAIREKLGGTLNDVVLAVLTAAVRCYVELHGVNVHRRSLRLMVPVNLRRPGADNGLGNRVSLLPVNTPLDLRNHAKLLDEIRQRTEALKRARVADWIHLAVTWMGMTPVPLQAATGTLSNLLPIPPFHMICTNVPGPQVPLHALGRKMLTYYPYVPIANQMALCCAIQSYNQVLYVGLTGDAAAVPDLGRMKQFIDVAFRELCRAARVHRTTQPRQPRVEKVRRESAGPIEQSIPAAPASWIGNIVTQPVPAVAAAPAGD
jgi:WS/DGAT/MGAT family acyltransferase